MAIATHLWQVLLTLGLELPALIIFLVGIERSSMVMDHLYSSFGVVGLIST